MRVLLVNTSEKTGGAAVAAGRLLDALNRNGVKAKLLVREKESEQLTVLSANSRWRKRFCFLWERLRIFMANRFQKKNLFAVDIANCGEDITRLDEFKEADIIHLHWINQGFLSIKQIEKILATEKPVIWTMHDMWPFTAVCHHARECEKFKSHCGNCPYLAGNREKDLSYRIFEKKKELFEGRHLSFIACSHWLENLAKQSSLIKEQSIHCVPNPINLQLFHPEDKAVVREKLGLPLDKKLILFGSVNTQDPRKGADYLLEACKILKESNPKLSEQVEVIVLGKKSEQLTGRLPFKVHHIGFTTSQKELAGIYNAADLFVTPSLEENLPNMIMEAMACGTPCVGFHIGGIPEMIDHKENGYVSEYRSADDLCRGMEWILTFSDRAALSKACVSKVATTYSETVVTQQIIKIYQKISGKNV